MKEWRTALLALVGVVSVAVLAGMGVPGFTADLFATVFIASITAVAGRSVGHKIGDAISSKNNHSQTKGDG